MPEITLGERLAELRLGAKLSLRDMGDKVGASAPHIRDIEQGHRRPSEVLLERMADALEVPLEELLRYSTRPPSKQMEQLIEQNSEYSLAFRKFVDAVREKHIRPSDIVDLSEKLPKKRKPRK
jgi:transcriptional regulator with XRE-family HTH domain